jgi:hypothetical protein
MPPTGAAAKELEDVRTSRPKLSLVPNDLEAGIDTELEIAEAQPVLAAAAAMQDWESQGACTFTSFEH